MIDIDAISDPARLREICRQLDDEAQGLADALITVIRYWVSSGYIRAKPRVAVLAPKAARPTVDAP